PRRRPGRLPRERARPVQARPRGDRRRPLRARNLRRQGEHAGDEVSVQVRARATEELRWLALGALLAIACVLLVAAPFLRDPGPADDHLDETSECERDWIALAGEPDRALAAPQELEFDHRTGKVSDDDYRAQVGPMRRRAADGLRALDPERSEERARVCLSLR